MDRLTGSISREAALYIKSRASFYKRIKAIPHPAVKGEKPRQGRQTTKNAIPVYSRMAMLAAASAIGS